MVTSSALLLALWATGSCVSGFQSSLTVQRSPQSPTSLASYLDSLTTGTSEPPKRALYGISGTKPVASPTSVASYVDTLTSPGQVAPSTASAAPPPATMHDADTSAGFPFGSASYFSLENLESKGPRAKVDWGIPADATRKLCDDGVFRAGAWYCSEGGWPSPNPKAHTEIFYVLEGYGSLDDADGVRHYFGPGDNVIIPKGHTGRWDVNQPIRKVWAVNDHPNIEERSTPIRVQVDHYSSWAPQYLTQSTNGLDPLFGLVGQTAATSKTFYDVGPTQVGAWASEPCSFPVSSGKRAWIYVLEGVMVVSNSLDGSARRCVAGDTIVVPEGWQGHVDVIEATKQLWTMAE